MNKERFLAAHRELNRVLPLIEAKARRARRWNIAMAPLRRAKARLDEGLPFEGDEDLWQQFCIAVLFPRGYPNPGDFSWPPAPGEIDPGQGRAEPEGDPGQPEGDSAS